MDNTFLPDNLLIRAIGNWNPKIFKPQWIKKNLLGEGELNFLVNPDVLELGWDVQGIKIFPKPNELMMILEGEKQITSDNILRFASLFIKTVSLLPHTPIEAIGFNITYTVKPDKKTKVTEWLLKHQVQFEDLSLTQIQVSKKCEKYILNIIVTKEGENHKVNFNYHFDNSIETEANYFLELYKDSERYL